MTADPLERLARRASVRRALALGAISTAIIVAVEARAATEPAPRSALGGSELALPVVPSASPAGPPAARTSASSAAAQPKPTTTHRRHAPRRTSTTPAQQAVPTTTPPSPAVTRTALSTTREITGASYDVSYGLVQVRITVRGARILDVVAVSLPQGGRSSDISAMAGPQLRREAITAQSARIDAVSGATYTSAGYAKSLQSALDKAALG